MADAMRQDWQRLRMIAALRNGHAEVGHVRAMRNEAEAAAALERGDAALADAVAGWGRQMDGFDPMLVGLHADQLTARATDRDGAAKQHDAAIDATARSLEQRQREDAREQAVAARGRAADRHARRMADERALMAIADREVSKWTRR